MNRKSWELLSKQIKPLTHAYDLVFVDSKTMCYITLRNTTIT